MDLIKQYIVQSIAAAAGNLRLTNQRIEVIALLKEAISKSDDIQLILNQMKKSTALSKLALKLNEMYQFLNQGPVDYLKISDKFKEQSFNLIKELNLMLDMVNPSTFRQNLDRMLNQEGKVVEIVFEDEKKELKEKEIDLTSNKSEAVNSSVTNIEEEKEKIPFKDRQAKPQPEERLIDANKIDYKNQSFDNFETNVLKPIKSIDNLLNQIEIDSEIPAELEDYSKLMRTNADLSSENGFDILSQMHEIIANGLMQLKNKSLIPSKEVIESMRACLIVIVAVVKSKEVDITNYLNRAEVFGKFLQKIKTEEIK
jgi:Fe2+ or Zn2+ uptake regulation protein